MNKGRKKTVYFRKDYCTARIAAAKSAQSTATGRRSMQSISSKKSNSEKLLKSVKKTAAKTRQTAAKLAKNVAKKVSSRRTTRKNQRQSFSWREVTFMSLLGTSAMMIALTFLLCSVLDPVKRGEQEISRLAERYYIEYLYPRALGDYIEQPGLILRSYEKNGLPNVRLTQLLSYNNNAHADSRDVFANAYYNCDLNSTYVKFYPAEPYGPRDFTVEYSMACERSGEWE